MPVKKSPTPPEQEKSPTEPEREAIPTELGLALLYARAGSGCSQTQLAEAAKVSKSLLCAYEKGKVLSREAADFYLALLGRPPETADVLGFAHRLVFPEAVQDEASPVALTRGEQERIHRATLAAGWACVETLDAGLVRWRKQRKADEAREAAKADWERLKTTPRESRRNLVAALPELRRWPLALLACEASIRAAAHNAQQALDLAELALFIAERVPDAESWRKRLEGYCWAHVGNARRVGNDFHGADKAFVFAWSRWRAGSESDTELIPEWLPLALEASLRRTQRQFPEALRLLDRAMASRVSRNAASLILLEKEHICRQMGDTRGALAALAEALPFIEASNDLRQLFALRFNTADNLCHLERFQDAADLMPQVRELAVQLANELDLIRVVWLEAKIVAGHGRVEEAFAGLERARGHFTACELPYEAALASLDLAVLLLQAGRTAEVRRLAIAMGWIFKAQGIGREALAALSLFCKAARDESATVELARHVIQDIDKVGRSASHVSRG